MRRRQLGKTGLLVSEMGFGTWGIGGAAGGDIAYGPTNDDTSRAALRRAFDQGITFYDTSDLYGFGHSEQLIGEVFKEKRQDIVIATKVGFVKRGDTLAQDFSSEHIKTGLQASLRRLQTDYIDLYQLHSPSLQVLQENPAALDLMLKFQEEGLIRAFGISVNSPDDATAAVEKFGAPAVQVNFNLVDQRILNNGFLRFAQERNIGVIGRTPLCFGFLGGGYSASTPFSPSDHRSKWPSAQIDLWANAGKAFDAVLDRAGETQNQLALRYCLSYPAMSTVIPGMLLPEHVDENIGAGAFGPFGDEDLRKLEDIYRRNRFFLGKGN